MAGQLINLLREGIIVRRLFQAFALIGFNKDPKKAVAANPQIVGVMSCLHLVRTDHPIIYWNHKNRGLILQVAFITRELII